MKIKNETESALRNSSSIVSFIGSFTRILGVCLRIHRSTHVSERRKKRLACFIEMNSSYENELKQLLKVREIQRLQENQLMLEHKNEFKQELDALSSQRQILPKQQLEQGKLGTLEEQQEEYKEGIRLHNEYEIQLYLKEKERLEMDYRQATNERRTLHWDATVVSYFLDSSTTYVLLQESICNNNLFFYPTSIVIKIEYAFFSSLRTYFFHFLSGHNGVDHIS